ncbi:MAG: PBP1A family penicillin-binding protein, partial [Desulfobacterales bacterium]
GIARAIIKDLQAGKFVEGASTITQQLAKTLFLTPRKSLVRKIKEAILAFQLERRYTKDEILEMYLNQVYFGSGAYGVESAAQLFFGKPVQDLNLTECALIAGMPKSPSRYSPFVNRDLALKRKNIVLRQMLDTGIIADSTYHQAVDSKIQIESRKKKTKNAPYFVEYVKTLLEETLGDSRLYKGGLSVHTTLDFKLQQTAEKAVADGLSALESRMIQTGIETSGLQSALISLDVISGGIIAMVGGKNFYESPFNRVIKAKRQPGSAFKPIVYAYAIEQGFSQNQLILDAPVVFKGTGGGDDWQPENFSKHYLGEITLRKALAVSQNIPAVRLIEMLGAQSTIHFAHRLGIESTLKPNLALALGTSEVTLMNLVAAYGVFPRKGKWVDPFAVSEVIDLNGRVVWRSKPLKRLVMSREGAAIMTNMLEGVVREGTGRSAQNLPGPIAGKTGTTNDYRDALFVGFSPAVVTGVWVGRDSGGTLGDKETGAKAALPIWMEFMQTALLRKTHQYFDFPENVIQVYMDPKTGQRSNDVSGDSVVALFKKGSEPQE